MDTEYKIKLDNVTKEYDLYKTKSDRMRNFFNLGNVEVPHFWSLKGVSMTVKPGETLGIIGINGSGKSTISNIISGIIPQTTGTVTVNGDTSIISIGAGLKWNLTGDENIRLKGLMQGLSIKEIAELRDSIVDFADIGNFINQPVKDYSTGMRSRLGFAIAVHINPDIMIIDEALSVGDDTFYQKCVDKIMEFKEQGKTILFVSHSLKQVEMLCDRVAWMHFGDLREIGEAGEVIQHYRDFSEDFKKKTAKERREYQQDKKQDQLDFNIETYQDTLIDQEVKVNGFSHKEAARKVGKVLYKQISPAKMTTPTKWMVALSVFVLLFFSMVNISGHSIKHSVKDPVSLVHPRMHKMRK
ncbi:ABC transporter ATP-binding protein [Pediococcus argentinicus]|uniref:TagH protein n=1 Tax=Pediococcus argentinicus TaxID=480391 RepID=A0A0R2NKA5_9LACO|nr:ABC transporter ATP-binding protein [Pediococcus argentinicus]KRO26181.1 tagH protein [Pediococcus argentinicus]NKZ21614.1 ABC transporter ATP-binding protein [Pediococcus argentinicus]GEP18801.1 teichoic acids export ATP-binding protein TagH [Pediococcus argentinicus]